MEEKIKNTKIKNPTPSKMKGKTTPYKDSKVMIDNSNNRRRVKKEDINTKFFCGWRFV